MYGAAEQWLRCINTVAVAAVPHWQTERARHQRHHHTANRGFPYTREGHLGELADPRHTGWETTPLAVPPYLNLQLAGKVPLPLELWDSTEMLFLPLWIPILKESLAQGTLSQGMKEVLNPESLHSLAVLWDALSSALPKNLLDQGSPRQHSHRAATGPWSLTSSTRQGIVWYLSVTSTPNPSA